MDATVCSVFYHTLYLGEVHRLATMVGAGDVAGEIDRRIDALATEVERASDLRVLPLRPLWPCRRARDCSRWRARRSGTHEAVFAASFC